MPKSTYHNLPPEKHNDIRSKAMDLFIQTPFEKIGVRDIAKVCEISIGSFYQYFDSKEAMYLHYYTEIEQKIIAYENQFTESDLTIWPEVDLSVVCSQQELDFNRTWYRMPNSVYSDYYFLGYAFRVNASLKEELAQMSEEGKLKDGLEVDAAFYTIVTSMYNFLLYCRQQNLRDHSTEIMPAKKYFFEQMILPAILDSQYYAELKASGSFD